MRRRLRPAVLASAISVPFAALSHASPSASPPRWTDETPDAMIDRAVERATAPGASDGRAVAAIATLDALADRGGYGHARDALGAIARGASLADDVKREAQLAARTLASDEGTEAGAALDRKLGVVTELALLGPFRDTGGGLTAHDGPEAKGQSFTDAHAKFSWGAYDVAWRQVPRAFAGAAGVPLDVFVHPRTESCTWVATKLVAPRDEAVVVRVAATGQVRLMLDGQELGRSDEYHEHALFDRVAARAAVDAGAHLVAAKVCAGALDDDGRVRLAITDDAGASLADATSADLHDALVPRPAKTKREIKAARKPEPPKALPTPLARTLAAAAKGDVTAQLDAAIARTLGGADDQRSPRAPGMLSTIASSPAATPDLLAMTGWIAPSGANRSAWLNLARDRATAAGDARAGAFAARRLIAEHVNAQMPDWGMASLGSIANATDAEAVLERAIVRDALGTDALRLAAIADLARAFHAAPQRVPTGLAEKLASMAASYDPALARDVREELARRGQRSVAWVLAESTRDAKAASEAARVALDTAGVADADDAIAVAQAASRAGAHDVARSLLARLVGWAPNRAEAWSGLADEIAATAPPAGDVQASDAIFAAVRRARDLAPGEARYREELALRAKGAPRAPTADDARDDEKYLVAPSVFLARRQGVPSGPPDVSRRGLHYVRAVVTHADHRVSTMIHYANEIVVAPRTEGELFEDIPYEGDLVEILRARVHRRAGGTAFPVEEHNEGSRPRIRWPELEPGDVIEVAVREWTSRPVGGRGDYPYYFTDAAGSIASVPLFYNEDDVETLPGQPLYLDVINGGDYRRLESDENGKHVVRLIWDHPRNVADEPLAPPLTELVPTVVGSTFHTWADFRSWYSEAVRGFTEPDDEVRALAAKLTKGKRTQAEKLRAVFDFVADDIRYVNYVSGEWWLPNRPQQLLARREGDCDDKAMLLITLLKSIGIDAQEVMVQTRETGEPSLLLAKNAAVPRFDHGIAFLPGPNGGTWLDATAPQSRLGPLPSMDARAVAFRMDAGPPEVVRMPASSPDEHGSTVTWTITLHPDGSADLAGEERHVGDGAFLLRTNLAQPDTRRNYVESAMLGDWFPTVEVDKDVAFQGDLPNGAAWVKYRAKSEGIARKESGELAVPIAKSSTLASQIAPLVKRTLPVQLPSYFAPSHETRTIRLVAPPGWAWDADLPPGGDAPGGDFGSAHLAIARDPKDARAVVVTRTIAIAMDRIPVDAYPAWRAWVQRVDGLMHKTVRLVKEGR